MLAPGPWVDWECIIKILRGELLQVEEFPQFPAFAFLIRGDAWPWPIFKSGRMAGPEIESLFAVAGLEFARLEEYREKYCVNLPPPSHEVLH